MAVMMAMAGASSMRKQVQCRVSCCSFGHPCQHGLVRVLSCAHADVADRDVVVVVEVVLSQLMLELSQVGVVDHREEVCDYSVAARARGLTAAIESLSVVLDTPLHLTSVSSSILQYGPFFLQTQLTVQ